MVCSVYDLKAFYTHRGGLFVRRLLNRRIKEIWPDNLKGLRVLGFGYACPYLRPYFLEAERTFNIMPSSIGVHHWPDGAHEKNLSCLADEGSLPLETESIDRILLVHGLEYAEQPQQMFQEMWRVLKSNGRILIIVPNRLGLWARADWTPFGHGHPYSVAQLTHHLADNYFVHEKTDRALFMPPFRSFLALRTAYAFENVGKAVFPGLAGVYVVEASKQVYANIGRGEKSRVLSKEGRKVLIPDTASNL
jgi:SAM-dependent methyltransferase